MLIWRRAGQAAKGWRAWRRPSQELQAGPIKEQVGDPLRLQPGHGRIWAAPSQAQLSQIVQGRISLGGTLGIVATRLP